MKKHVKPFTLFLCLGIIVYLVLGIKLFFLDAKKKSPSEFFQIKKPSWTGIITLWEIDYVQTGVGGSTSWLNKRIKEFEKRYPGIFIDVRRMTPQRAKMYFTGNIENDILPDIISISPYEDIVPINMYENLIGSFTKNDLQNLHLLAQKQVIKDEIMLGVPFMMGGYALFFNQDLLESHEITLNDEALSYESLSEIVKQLSYTKKEGRKEKVYYGFCSYNEPYSKPLVGMFYNGSGKIQDDIGYKILQKWKQQADIMPQDLWDMKSHQALKLFLTEKRVGVLLGNTQALYRIKMAQDQGKGFPIQLSILPIDEKSGLFQDQIAAYGLFKQSNLNKKEYCIDFLKTMLTHEAQADLKQISMFPVINDLEPLYSHDLEMETMEEALAQYRWGVDDKKWFTNHFQTLERFMQ